MQFTKGALALLGLALASVATAQDNASVSAEKTSGIKTIVPGAYGKLEVRHTTLQENLEGTDGNVNNIPALSFRPTLGTTLFDGKVDTNFTWIFTKKPDVVPVARSYFYNITTWTVF